MCEPTAPARATGERDPGPSTAGGVDNRTWKLDDKLTHPGSAPAGRTARSRVASVGHGTTLPRKPRALKPACQTTLSSGEPRCGRHDIIDHFLRCHPVSTRRVMRSPWLFASPVREQEKIFSPRLCLPCQRRMGSVGMSRPETSSNYAVRLIALRRRSRTDAKHGPRPRPLPPPPSQKYQHAHLSVERTRPP